MTRTAIYARYSSDNQRDASIADQLRLCRQFADRQGWAVVENYADHAMSGATMVRPAIQALLADAAASRFDIVVSEAIDRLSRDQEDVAAIYKRLSFAGVRIITVSEGEITPLHVGLKGTMNALYLKDLADKTRRGLQGRVEAGRSGGGNAYGYDVIASGGHDGDRGERRLNAAEAAIVQRIFREFAAGNSPRAIARDLNRDRVPGPRGRAWMDTTIRGHVSRGTGILNNELYIGRLVWNRLRYLKDPQTGRRVSRPNPPSEWVICDVPDLRIVDDQLWEAVKSRQAAVADQYANVITAVRRGCENRLNATHRPKSLLAGLLICGVCGGPYTTLHRGRFGCAQHYRRGTCENGRTVVRADIENRVLDGLRDKLLAPDKVEIAVREFYDEMKRLLQEAHAATAHHHHELHDVDRKIRKIVTVIENGGVNPSLLQRLTELESRKAEIQASLSATLPELPTPHPNAAKIYAARVAKLADVLADPEAARDAAEIIRSLVDKVVLTPGEKRGQINAELHGELAAIARLATEKQKSLTPYDTGVRLSVVAGAGFEPATFRL